MLQLVSMILWVVLALSLFSFIMNSPVRGSVRKINDYPLTARVSLMIAVISFGAITGGTLAYAFS